MKLAFAQITPFLEKPPADIRIVLFYGPDGGLARERADAFAKKIVPDPNDPFRTASLAAADLTDDHARLADEMAAISLGGGRRLVRIPQATESIAPALNNLIAHMPAGDSLLLIEAGDLEKRSKLRAICEATDTIAAAVPCYIEEGAARMRIVSDILSADNLRIAREALMYLCDILPPDRMAMRSELGKLALYVQGKKTVEMEDVLATVHDAGAAELDDLVFAVGLGEAKRVTVLLDRLLQEQTSTVAILRAAQRHFMRLSWARAQMDTGLSASEAVKKLQPPVFWKYADAMTAQLRRWSTARINLALQKLMDAEAAVKRTGTPDAALTAQLLLGMAA